MAKKKATKKAAKKKTVSKTVSKGERPQNKHLKSFKKGQSGNPKGRPAGTRNWKTVFLKAVEIYAHKNGKTPEQVEDHLMVNRIGRALKGDHRFDKDLQERLWGKIENKTNITMTMQEALESVFDDYDDDDYGALNSEEE